MGDSSPAWMSLALLRTGLCRPSYQASASTQCTLHPAQLMAGHPTRTPRSGDHLMPILAFMGLFRSSQATQGLFNPAPASSGHKSSVWGPFCLLPPPKGHLEPQTCKRRITLDLEKESSRKQEEKWAHSELELEGILLIHPTEQRNTFGK